MDNDTFFKLKQQGEVDRRNNLPANPTAPNNHQHPYNQGYNKR